MCQLLTQKFLGKPFWEHLSRLHRSHGGAGCVGSGAMGQAAW